MGAVANFIGAIVKVIADIAEGIWKAIKNMAKWIEDQIGWITTALIVLTVVAVLTGLGPAIAAYEGAMLSAVIANQGVLTGLSLLAAQAVSMAIALQAGFAAFLKAIYYDIIIRVHQIAYLVSPHYREMFQKVLDEIMNISKLLGLGPYFIILALENARTLVLTVSGLFGMKYDLAQVQWISVLNNFLKDFAKKADKYKNNPSLLLSDMADLINRPIMNQMGDYMQTMINTIDRVITDVDLIARTVAQALKDFDALVADLPAIIRDRIKPHTDQITKAFRNFYIMDYQANLDKIHGMLRIVRSKHTDVEIRVTNTISRLLYPGQYLHEIDALDPDLQTEQAWSLAEATNRPQRALYEAVESEEPGIATELQAILDALASRIPAPPFLRKELPTPIDRPQVILPKRSSWFVGDY